MTSKKELEQDKNRLRELIHPGDTVYTLLKHVSRSGMFRVIDLYIMRDNRPYRISGLAADLLEGYNTRHEGCNAHGCGMDMGFHLVYNLSYVLYPDYKCLKGSAIKFYCPSPDHVNHDGKDRAEIHHDGYALRHEWM